MDTAKSERWIVISALIVAGVYAYRRFREAPFGSGIGALTGTNGLLATSQFITAWGVTFLGCSIMGAANPELGGSFAILIASADLLANTPALAGDIQKAETPATGPPPTNPAKPTPPGATIGQAARNGHNPAAKPSIPPVF